MPLLGSLARLIARGGHLSDSGLQTLLQGTDLDDCGTASDELRRWAHLLSSLRAQPSETMRMATSEALLLRGLPEAAVLLAVATAAGDSLGTPKYLMASVTSLDLGTLRPDQPARAEFQVQGGPGRLIVENDRIQVTPEHFGVEPTRIHIEVKPLAGTALWTTLKLLTTQEALDVPLFVQWEERRPRIPESLIVLPHDVRIEPQPRVQSREGYMLQSIGALPRQQQPVEAAPARSPATSPRNSTWVGGEQHARPPTLPRGRPSRPAGSVPVVQRFAPWGAAICVGLLSAFVLLARFRPHDAGYDVQQLSSPAIPVGVAAAPATVPPASAADLFPACTAAVALSNWPAAEVACERVRERDGAYPGLGRALATTYVALGTARLTQDKLLAAVEYFDRALASQADDGEARRQRQLALDYQDADAAMQRGNPAGAAMKYEAVYRIRPDYLEGVGDRAVARRLYQARIDWAEQLRLLGQLPESQRRCEQALELQPSGRDALACRDAVLAARAGPPPTATATAVRPTTSPIPLTATATRVTPTRAPAPPPTSAPPSPAPASLPATPPSPARPTAAPIPAARPTAAALPSR